MDAKFNAVARRRSSRAMRRAAGSGWHRLHRTRMKLSHSRQEASSIRSSTQSSTGVGADKSRRQVARGDHDCDQRPAAARTSCWAATRSSWRPTFSPATESIKKRRLQSRGRRRWTRQRGLYGARRHTFLAAAASVSSAPSATRTAVDNQRGRSGRQGMGRRSSTSLEDNLMRLFGAASVWTASRA